MAAAAAAAASSPDVAALQRQKQNRERDAALRACPPRRPTQEERGAEEEDSPRFEFNAESDPASSSSSSWWSSRRNPFSRQGAIMRGAERLPVASHLAQGIHLMANDDRAYQRARNHNPFRRDGPLTEFAERVPLLNNVIQGVHRIAGREEAYERARDRNPLGPHGYVTQAVEHIPLAADAMICIHKFRGHEADAERARVYSLWKLAGKKGALTKLAELLPGTNLIAALGLELSGERQEALRALNWFGNVKDFAAADGVLAKLAELFPGTDVIAFGLQCQGGHYASALRSLCKTRWVDIRSRSTVFVLSTETFYNLCVVDVSSDLEVIPRVYSLSAGLLDIALHMLDFNRDLQRRRLPRFRRRGKGWMHPRHRKGISFSDDLDSEVDASEAAGSAAGAAVAMAASASAKVGGTRRRLAAWFRGERRRRKNAGVAVDVAEEESEEEEEDGEGWVSARSAGPAPATGGEDLSQTGSSKPAHGRKARFRAAVADQKVERVNEVVAGVIVSITESVPDFLATGIDTANWMIHDNPSRSLTMWALSVFLPRLPLADPLSEQPSAALARSLRDSVGEVQLRHTAFPNLASLEAGEALPSEPPMEDDSPDSASYTPKSPHHRTPQLLPSLGPDTQAISPTGTVTSPFVYGPLRQGFVKQSPNTRRRRRSSSSHAQDGLQQTEQWETATQVASAVSCFSFLGCCGLGLHTGWLACFAGTVAGCTEGFSYVQRQLATSLQSWNEQCLDSASKPVVTRNYSKDQPWRNRPDPTNANSKAEAYLASPMLPTPGPPQQMSAPQHLADPYASPMALCSPVQSHSEGALMPHAAPLGERASNPARPEADDSDAAMASRSTPHLGRRARLQAKMGWTSGGTQGSPSDQRGPNRTVSKGQASEASLPHDGSRGGASAPGMDVESPEAVILEWRPEVVENFNLGRLCAAYLVEESCTWWRPWNFLHPACWLLRCFEKPLCRYLCGALGEEDFPLVIPVSLAEGLNGQVWLPESRLIVILWLQFRDRRWIRRTQVVAVDGTIDEIANAVKCQTFPPDLRELDPRLADFTEPIAVDFKIGLSWSSPSRLNLQLNDLSLRLGLPQ